MSDVKPTPLPPATNEPSSTPGQKIVNSGQAGEGDESKGGGRRRLHDGRDKNNRVQASADDYSDSGSINRRGKRPEVQHYKPPGASKKFDETQGLTQDFDTNGPEESKVGSGTNNSRRPYRGRGRRGGHNYHNQGQNYGTYNAQQDDLDDSTRKIKQMAIHDDFNKYNENTEHSSYKGGTGGRRKKKPEQPHYIPKKQIPNDISSGSLERRSGNDGASSEDKHEHEKSYEKQLDAKSKDKSSAVFRKEHYSYKDDPLSKDDRYGSTKRARNKGNKKEYKKDIKEDEEHIGCRSTEGKSDKREPINKQNHHSNKDNNYTPRENGYLEDSTVDDISENQRTIENKKGGKDFNRKSSGGQVSRTSDNDPNLPPRLRATDKQERSTISQSTERGGRMGSRNSKSGHIKGGKQSRGGSPQGQNSSMRNDANFNSDKNLNSNREESSGKDDSSVKFRGGKHTNDGRGTNVRNQNQYNSGGSHRFARQEREKDRKHHKEGMKSSLSVSSDLSHSSDSFQQQGQDSFGAQTHAVRNKRNSFSNRGASGFKPQSPSPNTTSQHHSTTALNRTLSPSQHSPAQNVNTNDISENNNRNDQRFNRNRNSGISISSENQHGGFRRTGQHNRNSKDMADWRYYREGSHQSVSSDYDIQYQDARGGYHRGRYDDDRPWNKGNSNIINDQSNQSHREQERIHSGSRQGMGRSNSAVFNNTSSNVKHSNAVTRTAIPPRFQKHKDAGFSSHDVPGKQICSSNDQDSVKQEELNPYQQSDSDWGSWRGQGQQQTHSINNEKSDTGKNALNTPPIMKSKVQDSNICNEKVSQVIDSTSAERETSLIDEQGSTSDRKERIDSLTSDDFSSYSKVADWSLEVEEEEEQQREKQLQQKNFQERPNQEDKYSNVGGLRAAPQPGGNSDASHVYPHPGGLIRLPPHHSSSSSTSANWRRDQVQHHGKQNYDFQNSPLRPPVSADAQSQMLLDSNNPAWRGISNPEILHLQQQQQIAAAIAARTAANRTSTQQPFTGNTSQRYLYDPKNPNKPTHIESSGNTSSSTNPRMPSNTPGIISGARFAIDPRFNLPARSPLRHHNPSHEGSSHQSAMQQQGYTQNFHPITGQPLPVQNHGHFPPAYRPPFPNVLSGSSRANTPSSQVTMPILSTTHGTHLNSKQGASEGGQGNPHAITSSHPQMMHMESKPDFETIKYNEMALFETSKSIATNEFLSQGGQKLRNIWDTDVTQARRNILFAFQRLLQNDLVFCAEKDVEFLIWRICFYNLVETLKSMLKHSEKSPCLTPEIKHMIEQIIRSLLDEGLEFYSYMLDTLDKTYKIGLDKYYDVLEPRSPDANMRCVLVSAQKCLLCLGDLARYKEQTQETSNYGKARQYYQKASHIDTRNGRPYNQLAILAYTTKRKFEAVYYNMRCLSCKSSVRSSQESLTVIFEDIAKKWELSERKRLDEKENRKREAEKEKESTQLIKGTRLRKEIWIRPEGGGRRLHRTTSAQEVTPDLDELELKDMSTTDLNRRFNNTFLYIVGKLYTNINMDTFTVAAELLQKEFKILLSRSPLPIDTKRLVQIMALNMFVIEQTKMKNGDSERYRSVAQNSALHLSFGMFGVLLQRCNFLMETFRLPDFSTPSNLPQTVFSEEDLPTLLAAVKVWCDWLLGNNDTWFPIVSHEPFTELAKLATHLEKLKNAMKDIIKHFINQDAYYNNYYNQENYEMIKLGEDALLCGFNPWFCGLNWSTYRRYSHKSIPQTLAQDVRRLDTINDCIDYLEGHDPPILKWSIPDNAHISLVENTNVITSVERVNAKLTHLFSQEEDILEEAYSDEESGNMKSTKDSSIPQVGAIVVEEEGDGVNKIKKLKIRKEELERRKREDEEQSKLQKQILEEHVSVVIEVCPRQVVPDTNCFVDYLQDIQKIALDTRFQLRVPLVVLNELDGLAKGIKNEKSAKHDDPQRVTIIAEKAQLALAFLRDRPLNTKCVTYKGTILPSFGVTTEEDARQGKTNDDLILDTCINLASSSKAIDVTPTKDYTTNKLMRHIVRDIVLLTGDRNLRLKAHATDIPVNKLSDFIKWAFSK